MDRRGNKIKMELNKKEKKVLRDKLKEIDMIYTF